MITVKLSFHHWRKKKGEKVVKYYPKNYIPLHGGGESLFHFVLGCLFCKHIYEENVGIRDKSNQVFSFVVSKTLYSLMTIQNRSDSLMRGKKTVSCAICIFLTTMAGCCDWLKYEDKETFEQSGHACRCDVLLNEFYAEYEAQILHISVWVGATDFGPDYQSDFWLVIFDSEREEIWRHHVHNMKTSEWNGYMLSDDVFVGLGIFYVGVLSCDPTCETVFIGVDESIAGKSYLIVGFDQEWEEWREWEYGVFAIRVLICEVEDSSGFGRE